MSVKSRSLSTYFTLTQAFVVLLVLCCGGVGTWSISTLNRALEDTTVAISAVRNHMGADMMHDALRADVLSAIQAGSWGDAQSKETAKADLEEHVASFRGFIDANGALDLPDEIKAALADVNAPLAAYVAMASEMVDQAVGDPQAALQRMPQFMEAPSRIWKAPWRAPPTPSRDI